MTTIEQFSRSKRDVALRRCSHALIWTLFFEGLSWPLRYYEFIIYSYLPTVFYDYGPFTLIVIAIATGIYNTYLVFRYFETAKSHSMYPLAIVVIAHFIISNTSPVNCNMTSYHSLFKNEREKIVMDFCSGKLSLARGDCKHCVQLPSKWRHLSLMSDHIYIECGTHGPKAIFYTRWGFFSYWEALLYRFDGSYPDDPIILKSYKIMRLDDNWFYVIH